MPGKRQYKVAEVLQQLAEEHSSVSEDFEEYPTLIEAAESALANDEAAGADVVLYNIKKSIGSCILSASNQLVVNLQVGGSFDHLQFRRHIVRTLLARSEKPTTVSSGPASHPVDDVRFDGVDHHLEPGKQSRCRLCKKNARLQCTKCMVPLHLHCEEQYHTPE